MTHSIPDPTHFSQVSAPGPLLHRILLLRQAMQAACLLAMVARTKHNLQITRDRPLHFIMHSMAATSESRDCHRLRFDRRSAGKSRDGTALLAPAALQM